MKYTITINQKELIRIEPRSRISEAIVLDYLYWFCTSPSKKIEECKIAGEDGLKYTWIDYNWLIKEIPLMRGKTRKVLTPIFDKIEKWGFIKTIRPDNQKKYVALLPKIEELFSNIDKAGAKRKQSWGEKETNHSISNHKRLSNDNLPANAGADEDKDIIKNWDSYLSSMELDPKIHIRIIAYFLKYRKITFSSRKQVQFFIGRYSKEASEISTFKKSEIKSSIQYCRENYKSWSLKAVLNVLLNNYNKNHE